MKFWLDCEFQEDGRIIDLISLGLVSEDNRTFYVECSEYNQSKATAWIKNNVIPLLSGNTKNRQAIASDLIKFCGDWPEIWGWYGAYDWVALCQVFGTMMDLPKNWPMFIREAMQLRAENDSLPIRKTLEHHALNDAIWQRDVWYALSNKRMAA